MSKPVASSAEWVTEEYEYDTLQAGSFRTAITDAQGFTTFFCYDVDYTGTYGGSAIPTARSKGVGTDTKMTSACRIVPR